MEPSLFVRRISIPVRVRRAFAWVGKGAVRAFTLVELLVTVSIMVVITSIVLTGQSTFNQSLLLTDTAYTVALSVREAQSLGLSSRGVGGVYNVGYGVHFASGAPTGYTIFADTATTQTTPSYCPVLSTPANSPETKTGNCLYDSSTENVQAYTFSRGFKVSDFCGKDMGGTKHCVSDGYYQALDIIFLRPNTVAVLSGLHGATQVQLSCAEIYVAAPSGSATRSIRVSQLGEVSVSQTCP